MITASPPVHSRVVPSPPTVTSRPATNAAWVTGPGCGRVPSGAPVAFRAAGRERSSPTETIPDSADPDPEDIAVSADRFAHARALIERLPPQHREILVLRVALQFSAEETARIIGSTPGGVRVTQHRALSKLRSWAGELAE